MGSRSCGRDDIDGVCAPFLRTLVEASLPACGGAIGGAIGGAFVDVVRGGTKSLAYDALPTAISGAIGGALGAVIAAFAMYALLPVCAWINWRRSLRGCRSKLTKGGSKEGDAYGLLPGTARPTADGANRDGNFREVGSERVAVTDSFLQGLQFAASADPDFPMTIGKSNSQRSSSQSERQ